MKKLTLLALIIPISSCSIIEKSSLDLYFINVEVLNRFIITTTPTVDTEVKCGSFMFERSVPSLRVVNLETVLEHSRETKSYTQSRLTHYTEYLTVCVN